MARAFTDADIVQEDTGAEDNSVLTAVLPNGVGAGRAGIVVFGGAVALDPPEEWHLAAGSGPGGEKSPWAAILNRTDLEGGESSWAFTLSTTTALRWWVAEWGNVSFAPFVAKDDVPQTLSPTSIAFSAANVGDLVPAYTLTVAAITTTGGTTAGAWSAGGSWSGGFTETHRMERGPGNAAGDFQLRIARRYGALDETGPWTTTFTFGGSETNKFAYGAMAVFRAEHYEGDI